MIEHKFIIRDAKPSEYGSVGTLMVNVYSQLDGFPSPKDQPMYYKMLQNIGSLTENPKTRLLIAISENGSIGGGVVYFGDMKYYGSGGTAINEKDAAGFRLLAVDPNSRGNGLGKQLTNACIDLAIKEHRKQIVIHSTKAMKVAWRMYEKLNFVRSEDLDFMQEKLQVFGFRLQL
jgi:GNAT superfamily N-acetyltransferase